jgi:hypothetical protein
MIHNKFKVGWHPFHFFIEAIICESDSGLDYAEQLACAIADIATDDSTTRNDTTQPATSSINTTLTPTSSSSLFPTSNNAHRQFKHNGYLEARRDKYEMNEVCRLNGIPIVKQVLCRTPDEAIEMAQTVFCLESDETDGVSGSDRLRMNKSGVIMNLVGEWQVIEWHSVEQLQTYGRQLVGF